MSTANATSTRKRRAAILHDIRQAATGVDSRRLCAEHIESPDPALWSMQIQELVDACRQIGPRYRRQMLARVPLQPDRNVGSLTRRERDALYQALTAPRAHEAPAPARCAA